MDRIWDGEDIPQITQMSAETGREKRKAEGRDKKDPLTQYTFIFV